MATTKRALPWSAVPTGFPAAFVATCEFPGDGGAERAIPKAVRAVVSTRPDAQKAARDIVPLGVPSRAKWVSSSAGK
jgi:hypothetical protein